MVSFSVEGLCSMAVITLFDVRFQVFASDITTVRIVGYYTL